MREIEEVGKEGTAKRRKGEEMERGLRRRKGKEMGRGWEVEEVRDEGNIEERGEKGEVREFWR